MIWLLAAVAWGADLGALQADADRYPQDYAAWRALARGAQAEGAPDRALAAWRHAERLSVGNAETATGEVDALLALDEVGEARAIARAAEAAWPADPRVVLAVARARAGASSGVATWRAAVAEGAVREALALDPDDPVVRCAAADNARGLGDPVRAQHLADGLSCEQDAHPLSLTAGIYASTVAWSDAKMRVAALALARVTWNDTTWAEVAVRGVRREDGDGQQEVWGRFGLQRGLSGIEALAGATRVGSGLGPAVLGGRAWTGRGPLTLTVGGAHTGTSGGQLEAHVAAVLSGHVSVAVGLRWTTDSASSGWSADLGAIWSSGRWWIAAVVRPGTEVEPVRLDGPTLWDVDRTLTGSGALRFGYRVSARSTLSLGAEALRQQDAAWAVIPTAGLILTFGGSR